MSLSAVNTDLIIYCDMCMHIKYFAASAQLLQQCRNTFRRRQPKLLLATQLACAQTSDVTLLVFMKQLKALTKIAVACCAARMRPDPHLPAFSMAPPARVARALLQYLALLITTLCQKHQEIRTIKSVALSRRERTPQHKLQQQFHSEVVAAVEAHEVSRASYHEERGRPVPAKLPLRFKLIEANIKEFVGEPFPVISIWKCVHQTCRKGNVLEGSLLQGFVKTHVSPQSV